MSCMGSLAQKKDINAQKSVHRRCKDKAVILEPLSQRRNVTDLTEVYKLMHMQVLQNPG